MKKLLILLCLINFTSSYSQNLSFHRDSVDQIFHTGNVTKPTTMNIIDCSKGTNMRYDAEKNHFVTYLNEFGWCLCELKLPSEASISRSTYGYQFIRKTGDDTYEYMGVNDTFKVDTSTYRIYYNDTITRFNLGSQPSERLHVYGDTFPVNNSISFDSTYAYPDTLPGLELKWHDIYRDRKWVFQNQGYNRNILYLKRTLFGYRLRVGRLERETKTYDSIYVYSLGELIFYDEKDRVISTPTYYLIIEN